ncbi:hypothetical protein [Parasphingorhabdus sp.]|uniref:hypothetical protein n=1 Tax=Parasphingorhabdus sp. TaxID=2709688 RepID=UPI003A92F760
MATALAIWFYGAICIAALLVPIRQSLAVIGLGIPLFLVAGLLHFLTGGRTRARGIVPAGWYQLFLQRLLLEPVREEIKTAGQLPPQKMIT